MPTVVVAGASRGIGLEFVRQYAADGWSVIAGCRDPARAEALNAVFGEVEVHALDVASGGSVATFAAAVGERPVDLLLAVAGVFGGDHQHRPGEIDYDAWLRTLAVNTLGPVRLLDALLPNLKAGEGRRFVALTSGMGSTAENGGGYIAYRSSKAALNNAVKTLSLALANDGIVCVALNPGWVKTDMGGPSARLTPEESVSAMRERIAGYGPADSGRFLSWDGKQFEW